MSPTVTIIIPLFNAEKFITETVESILAQTFEDFEIIIVDDQSTDRSLSIMQGLVTSDSRIFIYNNECRKGAAGARNTGIRKANGQWIAFLDADDIYVKDALESRLAVLNKYPEAEFISADIAYLFEDSSKSEKGFYETRTNPVVANYFSQAYANNEILKIQKPIEIFLNTVMVGTDTVLLKNSLFEKVGVFEESLERCEDDHLWIRIARIADLYFVPKVVAYYRQHPASITKRDDPPGKWGLKSFEHLLKNPNFFSYKVLIRARKARFHADNAYYYRNRLIYLKAIFSAVAWVINDPFNQLAYRCLLAALLAK
jgi:glycosyltransferase involved in cell wall biosynthesis